MSSQSYDFVRRFVTFRGETITVLISKIDAPLFDRYSWCGSSDGSEDRFYIVTRVKDPKTGKRKPLYLHRLIMNPPEGMVIDHINGDTTDNRRSNLRIVTWGQNSANSRGCRTRHGRPTTSKYKGVSRAIDSKKWIARICHFGKTYYLGTHVSEVDAARAHDVKAYQIHGEHAYLNFPEERDNLATSCRATTFERGQCEELREPCPGLRSPDQPL